MLSDSDAKLMVGKRGFYEDKTHRENVRIRVPIPPRNSKKSGNPRARNDTGRIGVRGFGQGSEFESG